MSTEPTDRPLERRTISMTPEEAVERAMNHQDPDAGLIVSIMYQSLILALEDVLDEFEYEPETCVAEISNILGQVGGTEQPSIN